MAIKWVNFSVVLTARSFANYLLSFVQLTLKKLDKQAFSSEIQRAAWLLTIMVREATQ